MKQIKIDIEEIGKKAKGVLTRFQEVEFAYFFGSFLKNGFFSDIDMALHVSSDFSPYEQVKFSSIVGRKLEEAIKPRYEFDVKILNHAPLSFQYGVIKTGEIAFSRDEVKRIRYETKVLSRYLDYKETSDWLDRKFLARA